MSCLLDVVPAVTSLHVYVLAIFDMQQSFCFPLLILILLLYRHVPSTPGLRLYAQLSALAVALPTTVQEEISHQRSGNFLLALVARLFVSAYLSLWLPEPGLASESCLCALCSLKDSGLK